MKLSLILGLVSVIAAVQAEIASTENQGNPTDVSTTTNTTGSTDSTSAWSGPVNITEPTSGTKWEAGSLHTIKWIVLNRNGTDNSTTDNNSTHGDVPPGNNSTDGGHGDGNGNGDDNGGHGNNTDTNNTHTDHLTIQLAVDLAHNASKRNGTAQIFVPQHIGGKNFTLAVGQPDQGVSFVTGIDIDDNDKNKNGTHDKNGTVNPD